MRTHCHYYMLVGQLQVVSLYRGACMVIAALLMYPFSVNFCMSFHMDMTLEFFCIADAFKYYGGCTDKL